MNTEDLQAENARLREENARLGNRLSFAEDVCAAYGWTAVRGDETVRDKALHEIWVRWAHHPDTRTDAAAYPHLSDEELQKLADQRDTKRAATLARFFVGEQT